MGVLAIIELVQQGIKIFGQVSEQTQAIGGDVSDQDLASLEAKLEELTAARHKARDALNALIASKR